MNQNLDTLLTALYVDLDDRVLPVLGVTRDHVPGRKPGLSDAELLCLAVAQELLQFDSERRFVRFAKAHLVGLGVGAKLRVSQHEQFGCGRTAMPTHARRIAYLVAAQVPQCRASGKRRLVRAATRYRPAALGSAPSAARATAARSG